MNALLFHFSDPDHYAPNDWPFILGEEMRPGLGLFVGRGGGGGYDDHANGGLKGVFASLDARRLLVSQFVFWTAFGNNFHRTRWALATPSLLLLLLVSFF